jgi:hypothetical protein
METDARFTVSSALSCDLVRRQPAGLNAEERLLWAVLEDAIGCYLASMECATPEQCREFVEVCQWLANSGADRERIVGGTISFRSLCASLHIDPARLLAGLAAAASPGDHEPEHVAN